ncbi:TATA box-binding protein-associated factor RNA polymerase I subunit B isoform X1 [Drosophila elegans]|uniref:TATA box-binding protein-associated factor RNA polymerase I subunit B isoform X1 n=2 Tax=Drosophila elegans TaxID=30023 RepID=UPI0007E7BF1E|nr:TATA box-binding protein-associated factor RNA polymerase I subunit B isoform X1 [Drosophila elegans]
MEEVLEVIELENMQCNVCGEQTFQERAGFYYCVECGTQKDHIRAVDLTADENFNENPGGRYASRTIRQPKETAKADDDEITSWEFYNYVLRGFVQELLNMGAKPELKLMTLQVWAAYMGRMEVAFCRTNENGLPKLNVRALHRDARIIYNRKRLKLKRGKKARAVGDPNDDRAKFRLWNKTKRNLDASGYSQAGGPSESEGEPSLNLQWSLYARKSLKRQMPLKHLDKHSKDSKSSMSCHELRPKAKELQYFDRNMFCLNITKLYVILGIALNMVEDDIQLTDLLRFIDEEHLSKRCLLNYLPEKVAAKGKALFKDMEFGNHKDKCTYKFLRQHVGYMSRYINLSHFQKPNLHSLAERYILELGLPSRLVKYVGSLIDLYPPSFFNAMGPHTYPRYEARTMAYILYAMKLLFGLDDVKEQKISESAAKINEQLLEDKGSEAPLLFVFTEWMQFVDIRKVIVSHYNQTFAHRFGVATQIGRKVDDILAKERKEKEQGYNYDEVQGTPAMQRQHENLTHIIETMLKEHFGESSQESVDKVHIEFQPSLTPAHSYFKRILLQASRPDGADISLRIPDCMHVDHAQRDLDPFVLETNELSNRLSQLGLSMRVEEVACQEDFQNVGLFRPLQHIRSVKREFRANTDIKTETWLGELKVKEKRPDFRFFQPTGTYGTRYLNRINKHYGRRERLEVNNPYWEITKTPTYLLKVDDKEVLLDTLSSLQTFKEGNMEPLKVPLDLPRRHLERRTICEEAEKDEEDARTMDTNEEPSSPEELLLRVSNFDCWLLHGYISTMRESDKRELRQLFPCSFRWLLETCAATIGVSWTVLYEQLLILEVMFHHSIGDWSNHRELLCIQHTNQRKDIRTLARTYKEFW